MASNNDGEEHKTVIDNLQKWFEENKNLPKQIGKLQLKEKHFYIGFVCAPIYVLNNFNENFIQFFKKRR